MITRRSFLAGAGSLAAMAATPAAGRAQATVKIDELAGVTGPIAVYGQCVHNTRLLALDEINGRGG